METFVFLGFLVNAAMIVAGAAVLIAIWHGMKALEKMAHSVARVADAAERIEKFARRNEEPRV
jgi:hypothetical protein